MLKSTIYRIYYHIIIYIVAFFSVLDEIQYKLGLKKTYNVKRDFKGDLRGRVAVVTGGTRGLGLTVVKELIANGCYVFVASSQTEDKFPHILENIYSDITVTNNGEKSYRGEARLIHLDLSSMSSVKKFSKIIIDSNKDLNYLICNAGIMFAPRSITGDNFELHLSVNYLGHCILTMEFLPILIRTAQKCSVKSRIVNVSSSTHRAATFDFEDLLKEKYYSGAQAYGQSKLAQIMFSASLARRLSLSGYDDYVQIFCLHPGVVISDLYEHVSIVQLFPKLAYLLKFITRNIVEGAETTLYATLSGDLDGHTNKYLEDCEFKAPSKASQDVNNQERLWQLTHHLLEKWIPSGYKRLIKE